MDTWAIICEKMLHQSWCIVKSLLTMGGIDLLQLCSVCWLCIVFVREMAPGAGLFCYRRTWKRTIKYKFVPSHAIIAFATWGGPSKKTKKQMQISSSRSFFTKISSASVPLQVHKYTLFQLSTVGLPSDYCTQVGASGKAMCYYPTLWLPQYS